MLKNEFLGIVEDISALFSWNREIGVEYLDISEDSIKIINSWDLKQSSSSYTSNKTPAKQTQGNKPANFKDTHTPIVNKANASNRVNNRVDNPVNNIITADVDSDICCQGDINSQLFFFAEHFVYDDPVGELFSKILKAMNLNKDRVCLCTFPVLDYNKGIPQVRQQVNSIREKTEQCINDIKASTNGLNPKIICTLGDHALKILMGREYMVTTSRGKFHNYKRSHLMPTYHPSQIMADIEMKRLVWGDMKQIMGIMGSSF